MRERMPVSVLLRYWSMSSRFSSECVAERLTDEIANFQWDCRSEIDQLESEFPVRLSLRDRPMRSRISSGIVAQRLTNEIANFQWDCRSEIDQ